MHEPVFRGKQRKCNKIHFLILGFVCFKAVLWSTSLHGLLSLLLEDLTTYIKELYKLLTLLRSCVHTLQI